MEQVGFLIYGMQIYTAFKEQIFSIFCPFGIVKDMFRFCAYLSFIRFELETYFKTVDN